MGNPHRAHTPRRLAKRWLRHIAEGGDPKTERVGDARGRLRRVMIVALAR